LHHCFNYCNLFKNNNIRKFPALALLLLFMISNMPKQLMHDLFANHVDYKVGITNHDTPHLNQLSFHCQVNHFVVETPYAYDQQTVVICKPLNFRQFTSSLYQCIAIGYQSQPGLRGPPVI